MTVALIAADDPSIYGGKAVQLGTALRAGLPVPDGVALGWSDVDAVAAGDPAAAEQAMRRHLGHVADAMRESSRQRTDGGSGTGLLSAGIDRVAG